jgi:hypothetical protein
MVELAAVTEAAVPAGQLLLVEDEELEGVEERHRRNAKTERANIPVREFTTDLARHDEMYQLRAALGRAPRRPVRQKRDWTEVDELS